MSRKDLRVLLHIVGGVCWVVSIAADLEEHNWRAVAMALASHAAAEILGGFRPQ